MTIATAHNGGKSQVNLNYLQNGGDYPFLNCMKNAGNTTYADNSNHPSPDELDVNGYPLATSPAIVSHTGLYWLFNIPPLSERPGRYVVTWSGNGTIFVQNGSAATGYTSANLTSTTGSGRYEFNPNSNRVPLGISATGSGANQITNLQCFHYQDEASLATGEIFQQKFLSRLKEANFGVIRFGNWQDMNSTNVSQWKYRRSVSYIVYADCELRPGIYAGITSLNGTKFAVGNTPDGFVLADKATVIVRFGANVVSQGTACTLNVNSTGDIPIVDKNAQLNFWAPAVNQVATFVYDSLMNVWIYNQNGIDNGIPIDVALQLCAEVGANPHFITPILASEQNSDYWTTGLCNQIAAFKTANGVAWLSPHIEPPNELWNPTAFTNQVKFASAKQTVINGGAAQVAASAFTYPSPTGGAGYADIVLATQPYQVGSRVFATGFDTNGTANVNGYFNYVTAINVGGNANKVTVRTFGNPPTGTYSGTGGTLQGETNDYHNFYGRILSQIGQACNAVFGGSPTAGTTYKVLCGVQTGYADTLGGAQTHNDRLASTQYVLQGGSAAKNWTTHGCVANYWTSSDYNTLPEVTDAFNYAVANIGNPSAQASIVAAYLDNAGGTSSLTLSKPNFNLARNLNIYANWKTFFKSFGVNAMLCYEGGYTPDFWSINDPANPFFYGAVSIVTGASQATQCVLTLATTFINSIPLANLSYPGNPAVPGQQLDLFGIQGMTQLNCSSAAVNNIVTMSFTGGGSPNITWGTTPVPIVGQLVSFGVAAKGGPYGASNTVPPEITPFKSYWVVSSVSGVIQVSSTKGGAPIAIGGSPAGCWAASGWMVLAVNGNSVTIDMNSSSATPWVAGGTNSQIAVYDQSDNCVNILRSASKYVSGPPSIKANGIGDWMTQDYTNFTGLSDANFSAVFPSMFQLSSALPDFGFDPDDWSVLVDIYRTPDPPMWTAVRVFNAVVAPIQAFARHLRLRFHG